MPSKEKKERVKQIRKWFEKSDSLLVLRYRGLRVAEANEFRVEIKNNDAELRVLKNTLTRLALADTPTEEIIPMIDGPIAVVFTSEDMAPVARVIKEFSRGREELYMMGGFFQGTFITAEQADRLATLPPREVVLARMVGQVAAPLSGLIGVCVGPIRKMMGVLAAIADKKEREKEPEAAEAAPEVEEEKPEEDKAETSEVEEEKPEEDKAETSEVEEKKPEEDKAETSEVEEEKPEEDRGDEPTGDEDSGEAKEGTD